MAINICAKNSYFERRQIAMSHEAFRRLVMIFLRYERKAICLPTQESLILRKDSRIFGFQRHVAVAREFTVYASDFDASRRRKKAVSPFSTAQAGRLQESEAPIVMKWVVAGFVVAIDRDALEAIDGPPCGSDRIRVSLNRMRKNVVCFYAQATTLETLFAAHSCNAY